MKNQKGFTLVELCITLAIMGITLLFSFPSIASWKNNESLKGEIRHMTGTLMGAKLHALKENQNVVIQFNDTGYLAFIDDGSSGGITNDAIHQPGEKVIADHETVPGLTLSTNFLNDRTKFKGTIGMVGGSIIMKSKDKAFAKVVLALTGRVRVEKL